MNLNKLKNAVVSGHKAFKAMKYTICRKLKKLNNHMKCYKQDK